MTDTSGAITFQRFVGKHGKEFGWPEFTTVVGGSRISKFLNKKKWRFSYALCKTKM